LQRLDDLFATTPSGETVVNLDGMAKMEQNGESWVGVSDEFGLGADWLL